MIVFSFLINALFLKFSKTLGIRDKSDTIIRWGTLSKPALGGISFYIIFILSYVSYSIFFYSHSGFSIQAVGLLIASTIAFLMGLADDAYNTKPILKFIVQIFCSVVLIATGTYIKLFDTLLLNYLLTGLWIVGLMNSINMLDNMDAITTTVSLSIVLSALLILFINKEFDGISLLILLGLSASLTGFLFFNWHPSKMYMGDTGSQFLGIVLGSFGIIYFWNSTDLNGMQVSSKQFIVAILTFIIPIIDTSVVVINRLLKKQSPFIGGKDHTTHHLSYMGLADSRIAFVFAGLSILSMLFTIFILKFTWEWGYLHIITFGLYIITLFIGFMYITHKYKNPDKTTKNED